MRRGSHQLRALKGEDFRCRRVTIYLTDEQYDLARVRAGLLRVSLSRFFASFIGGENVGDEQVLLLREILSVNGEVLAQLGRVGSNLNQIAKALNSGQVPNSNLGDVFSEFSDVKNAALEAQKLLVKKLGVGR